MMCSFEEVREQIMLTHTREDTYVCLFETITISQISQTSSLPHLLRGTLKEFLVTSLLL